MSVLGSQSGLSEQTFSDADDSNVPVQHLADTVDRRKAQNRIAQRKHRQKLKKRIEELELQLEYAGLNSRPMLHRTSPHPIPMTMSSYSNSTEENMLPHVDQIEDFFTRPNNQFKSFRSTQEHSSVFGHSPPLGHDTMPLIAEHMSPLPMRNSTSENPGNRPFNHAYTRRGAEPSAHSLWATPTTHFNEITMPGASRGPLLHPMNDAAELIDPVTPRSWNMERKIAYIVDCAKMLGFRDFDSVVTTYYTTSFEVMSRAHDMQKVSRIRGLGSVLRALDASAEAWPHHESQIFQAEIFKAAEHLYRAEFQKSIDSGALMVLEGRMKENEINGQAVKVTSHKSELLSQVS
ncbi:hypothetical protein FVEG_09938 [Fusarium verticillioides 7600]|uniref:BZIP domain-containing protein n=1 Tax=Gibberella moniliformis (strain M3125 / FGSC 7600) TaxID=334819 RepID=W7MGI0_GIBM7|nr:hypothetical protein FVEG_09938 [Fusarium verticillioides 7600]EWG50808.1 hypothetical protein FVEG_09938 [Fusarium verticillioides 7600]